MKDTAARLFKRLWEGVLCNCRDASGEKQDLCSRCFGTGYHGGYEYFGPVGLLDFEIVEATVEEMEDELWPALKAHVHYRYHVTPGDLLVDHSDDRWKIMGVTADDTHRWKIWARKLAAFEGAWFFLNSEPTRRVLEAISKLKEAAQERPSTNTPLRKS
jgi:hypothetical protein